METDAQKRLTNHESGYRIEPEVMLSGWVVKLARRVLGLQRGYRYQITLTMTTNPDWTIVELGKIEK